MYQFNSAVFMLWLIQPQQCCKTREHFHLHTVDLVPEFPKVLLLTLAMKPTTSY